MVVGSGRRPGGANAEMVAEVILSLLIFFPHTRHGEPIHDETRNASRQAEDLLADASRFDKKAGEANLGPSDYATLLAMTDRLVARAQVHAILATAPSPKIKPIRQALTWLTIMDLGLRGVDLRVCGDLRVDADTKIGSWSGRRLLWCLRSCVR